MAEDEDLFKKEMDDASEKIGRTVLEYLGGKMNAGPQKVSLERMAATLICIERVKTFLTETLARQGIEREEVEKLINAGKESDVKVINELLDKNKESYEKVRKHNQWLRQPPKPGG